MKIFRLLVVLLVGFAAWHYFSTRPVHRPPGVLAASDPVQVDIPDGRPFAFGKYQVTPLAQFNVRARVLSAETYSHGREADLSPIDLALGWGRMSDSAVIDKLAISQGGRFYFYSWTNQPPLPPQEIIEHSANMHLIPANALAEKQLGQVRVGNIVDISGYLVRADAQDGWRWISSLTRMDSGNGSCEVVFVERLAIK